MKWNDYSTNEKIICKNIDEFLKNLTSFYKQITAKDRLEFIYRGVPNDAYKLIPTALRRKEDDLASYEKLWKIYESRHGTINDKDKETELFQRKAELSAIQAFYEYAEKSGLPLPKIIDSNMRDEILTGLDIELQKNTYGEGKNVQWPPKDLLPIFALAQHYGLPTRLLDWSRSPLTAIYFAASGALERLKKGDDPKSLLCVYSTVSTFFSSYSEYENSVIKPYPFRLVQPASSENPNLKLQQGVFTVYVNKDKIDNTTKVERGEIHELCNKFPSDLDEPALFKPKIYGLYISISEAPELLVHLKEIGYSANRIYDGYSGAVKAIEEEILIMELLNKNKEQK